MEQNLFAYIGEPDQLMSVREIDRLGGELFQWNGSFVFGRFGRFTPCSLQ